ncbi:MAG: TIR domain-containing protein [Calditrichia bacterium]
MKPKIFIGSSVEGLSIAYSIQQNLTHDAEITVWDQGVFELSSTTIESLVKILENSDFGIFVFSNDDITKIRDKELETIRDNVLFEFGLFIGKLSRERVYFVIPSDTELHLPTDLLGITPGKFDPNREDGSLQAATGAVSNQIRLMMKKLGKINPDDADPSSSDRSSRIIDKDNAWHDDFLNKKYVDAQKKLKALIKKTKEPEEKVENELWSLYCDMKNNEQEGIKLLDKYLKKNYENIRIHKGVARIYMWEDYLDKSSDILSTAIEKFNSDPSLILVLSQCYKKSYSIDKSIQLLKDHKPTENPDIAVEIVTLLMEENEYHEARAIIHETYNKYPNNENVKYKYALLAIELEENEIALFLLNSLTIEFDNNSSYWGYLSNTAVQLDFYDLALSACRKAEDLSNSKEEWIKSNIGNMLKNKGFYTESIEYFEKGIGLDKSSDYAHERLASALKLKEEENKKVQTSIKSGLKQIREYIRE